MLIQEFSEKYNQGARGWKQPRGGAPDGAPAWVAPPSPAHPPPRLLQHAECDEQK